MLIGGAINVPWDSQITPVPNSQEVKWMVRVSVGHNVSRDQKGKMPWHKFQTGIKWGLTSCLSYVVEDLKQKSTQKKCKKRKEVFYYFLKGNNASSQGKRQAIES